MLVRRVTRILMVVGLAILFGPVSQAVASTVTLSPTNGAPKTQVAMSGTGFDANSGIELYFDTTQVAFTVTNSAGAFNGATVTVPASATPGTHWLTAAVHNSSHAAQAAFLVRGSWPQERYGAAGQADNVHENVLTSSTVGGLDVDWSAPAASGRMVNSSPVVAGGRVFLLDSAGVLSAYSTTTHAKLWSVSTGFDGSNAPTYAKGLLIATGGGKLVAYSATTGALVWRAYTGGATGVSPATSDGTNAYVIAEGSGTPGVYAFALNCASGGASCLKLWRGNTGSPDTKYSYEREPTVADGKVFATSVTGLSAFASDCASAGRTCAPLWSATASPSPPAFSNGLVFVDRYSELDALDADSGSISWTASFGGDAPGDVAIAGHHVLVGASNRLYSFDATCAASPCLPEWSTTTPYYYPEPSVAGNVVYVHDAEGISAYPVNCYDGCTPSWRALAATNWPVPSVAVVDGVVYAPASDGRTLLRTYALDSTTTSLARPSVRGLQPSPRFRSRERSLLHEVRARR